MSSLISLNGNELSCSVSSAGDAKLAIKELKLLKKGFALKKREVAAAIKAVRFNYSQVKSRGSMMRGGGGFGRFIRVMQSASRDSRRSSLAQELHPLETEKTGYERTANAIDEMIVKLEIYLHDQ